MAVRVARPLLLLTLLLILITLTSGLLGPPKKYAGEDCEKNEECWAKRTTKGCVCDNKKCSKFCMGNGGGGAKAAKSAKAAEPKPTVLQGGQCKLKTDCIKINPSATKCYCSFSKKGDKKICRGENCKPIPAAPKTKAKKTISIPKPTVLQGGQCKVKTDCIKINPSAKKCFCSFSKKGDKKICRGENCKPNPAPKKKAKKKLPIPKSPKPAAPKPKVKKGLPNPISKLKKVFSKKTKTKPTCTSNKDCPGFGCKCVFGKCRGIKCKKAKKSKAEFGDFGDELYVNDMDYNYIPQFSVMFISIITLCLCGVFCICLSVIMGLFGWYIGKYVLQYSENNKNYKLIQRDGITDIEQNNE